VDFIGATKNKQEKTLERVFFFLTCVQVFNKNRKRGSNRGNRGSIMVGRGSFLNRGVHYRLLFRRRKVFGFCVMMIIKIYRLGEK